MNDGVLVEALRARDPGALAALYDTYAESIYRYCRVLLSDPDAAQVALRDTLIAAEALVATLADPQTFRPWLYALARGECLRRRVPGDRERGRQDAGGDRHARRADEGAAPSPVINLFEPASSRVPVVQDDCDATRTADADLRAIAVSAVSALGLADREVLELTTRHDLSTAELAIMLGTGQRYIEGLYESATDRLRDAVTAEVLARRREVDCERAAKIVADSSGRSAAERRDRLIKHLSRCESCRRHRVRQVSPAKVFGLLPEARLPETLRVRLLSCFVDPDLVPYRRFVAKRVGPLAPSGFPRIGTKREGRVAQAIAGVVATLAAAAAVVLVFAQFSIDSPSKITDVTARRWPVGESSGGTAPDATRATGSPADAPETGSARTPAPQKQRGRAEPRVIPAGPIPLPTPAPRPVPPAAGHRHSSGPPAPPQARPSGPKPRPSVGGPSGAEPSGGSGGDAEPSAPPSTPSVNPVPPGHRPPPPGPGRWPGHGDHLGREHQSRPWPWHGCWEREAGSYLGAYRRPSRHCPGHHVPRPPRVAWPQTGAGAPGARWTSGASGEHGSRRPSRSGGGPGDHRGPARTVPERRGGTAGHHPSARTAKIHTGSLATPPARPPAAPPVTPPAVRARSMPSARSVPFVRGEAERARRPSAT